VLAPIESSTVLYCVFSVLDIVSKKQSSIKSSTFGLEFMALKTVMEIVQGLWYKLRIMGIPIEGPAHARMRVDNMSVVYNTASPDYMWKKKSNLAARWVKIGYENTKLNLADILTKVQDGPKQKRLADMVKHFPPVLTMLGLAT
jgi:hypothetical protein